MIISDVKFKQDHAGYPYLSAKIDGERVKIGIEQKVLKYGLVFIGPEFAEKYQAILPADPENSRPEAEVLRGFTDNPELVGLITSLIEQSNKANWKPE